MRLLVAVLAVVVVLRRASCQDDTPPAPSGCKQDWYPFGERCYRIGGRKRIESMTWERASQKCVDYGGRLATVHSKELQEFLVAFLMLSVKNNLWIGLHDRINESQYEWVDGSPLAYTNWEPTEPSGPKDDKEDCVEMVFQSKGSTGQWNDIDCKNEKLFVCQMDKDPQMKKATRDPRLCPDFLKGGWSLQQSCLNVVSQRLTWSDAERHCADTYQGHLVAITDFTVQLFVGYLLRNFTKQSTWIGIHIQEASVQKWSSGWHVAYESWESGSEKHEMGSCAVRHPGGSWATVSCQRKLAFVCELSTRSPPLLRPPADPAATCPEEPGDWKDLGGEFCYYFDTEKHYNWYKANFICMRRGGTLASIHSQAEVDALQQFVLYRQNSMYIGLFRHQQYEEDFGWADGSPFDFQFWDSPEPNSEDEQCVEMRTATMAWNDLGCDQERGYVCSVRKRNDAASPPHGSANATETTDKQHTEGTCKGSLPSLAVVGLVVCLFLVVLLIGVVLYCFRPWEPERAAKASVPCAARVRRPRYRSNEIVVKEDDEEGYENVR